MNLFELFDRAADFSITREDHSHFETVARINDRKITFTAYKHLDAKQAMSGNSRPADTWSVIFQETYTTKTWRGEEEITTYKSTGHGGELEVFKVVLESLKTFIEKYKPTSFKFDADKAYKNMDDKRGDSRVELYTRMANRFKPADYDLTTKGTESSKVFIFTRKS